MRQELPKAFSMDFDGNVAHTRTPIFLLKACKEGRDRVEVDQRTFDTMIENQEIDQKHWRYVNDNFLDSAILFRTPGNMYDEFVFALENDLLGPSSYKMREAARAADPLFLNTARRASIQEMMAIHRRYIFGALTLDDRKELIYNMKRKCCRGQNNETRIIEKYLMNNRYYGTSHPEFLRMFGLDHTLSTIERKKLAFKDATQHAHRIFSFYDPSFIKDPRFSHGFSDDNRKNILGMQEYIQKELIQLFPSTTFFTYDTSDHSHIQETKF